MKVEVDVLGSMSLIFLEVSVGVKQHRNEDIDTQTDGRGEKRWRKKCRMRKRQEEIDREE